MDLVTIITPVYNGEKYLQRYFAQINAIGYKNLQIIVVNDGSKDETSEIVQKYAEEDSRIEFIDKKVNEGVSSARNDALKREKGNSGTGTAKFLWNIDSRFKGIPFRQARNAPGKGTKWAMAYDVFT